MEQFLGSDRLEAQIVDILNRAGVPIPEADACIKWAFGADAWEIPIYPNWVDRWNKLHPTAFRAQRADKFVEFVYVVGTMYLTQQNVWARRRKGIRDDEGEV